MNCDKVGALGADCTIWAVDCTKVEPPGREPSSPKYCPKLLLEKKYQFKHKTILLEKQFIMFDVLT